MTTNRPALAPPAPLAAYLCLRARTVGRQLREVGWVRWALLLPFLLALAVQVLRTATPHPWGRWVLPIGWALFAVLPLHRQRPDWRFLAAAAPAFRPWLAAEYALLTVPLAVGMAALGAPGPAALALGLAAAVAAAGPARGIFSAQARRRSWFRSAAFEWVSGLRAGRVVWAWPVLLAGAGWWRATPVGPVAALAAWLLVVASCYGTPEPAPMLLLGARTPGQWLRQRLGWGLGYTLLTATPFLGLMAVGPAGPVGALAAGAAGLGLVALMIFAKYAFYPSGFQIRFSQGLLGLCLLYPWLLPLVAAVLPWQSHRRLRDVLGVKLKAEKMPNQVVLIGRSEESSATDSLHDGVG